MPIDTGSVRILSCDHTREGLILHFSNGEAALFNTMFLFNMRSEAGNKLLENSEAETL